jgi:hypothetical protein
VGSVLRVRRALPADAVALAPRLREEDAAECWRLDRSGPTESLADSLDSSAEAWAAELDGVVIGLWGVRPHSVVLGVGMPWMLGAPEIARSPRLLVRGSRHYCDRWLTAYRLLVNVVDARYTKAIRWVRSLGFTVSEPYPVGPDGHPFVWIEKGA